MMMLFGITQLLDALLFVLHCNHVTIVVDEFYNGGVANVNTHMYVNHTQGVYEVQDRVIS